MPRLLYIFDPVTGKRFGERDVSRLSEHEVMQAEILMRCKWDLYGVFVDTDTDSDPCSGPVLHVSNNHQA